MQPETHVAHLAKLLGWNLEFGVDLVDDRASPAGALVIHRGNLLLLARRLVGLEDDDLGILPAEFHDALHVGIHFFDRQTDGIYLLHELRPDSPSDARPARAGHEHAEGI